MRRHALAACLAALGLLTACTAQEDGISGLSTPGVPGPAEPGTLRVLASSELSDMAPVLARVEKEISKLPAEPVPSDAEAV